MFTKSEFFFRYKPKYLDVSTTRTIKFLFNLCQLIGLNLLFISMQFNFFQKLTKTKFCKTKKKSNLRNKNKNRHSDRDVEFVMLFYNKKFKKKKTIERHFFLFFL